MHRATPWRTRVANTVASWGGKTAAKALRTGPGVVGAGLVTVGVGGWHWQLACLVGGAFLLVVDHRTPL